VSVRDCETLFLGLPSGNVVINLPVLGFELLGVGRRLDNFTIGKSVSRNSNSLDKQFKEQIPIDPHSPGSKF
jgi:hypothetical protein